MRRVLIAAMLAALFGSSPAFAQVGGMGSPTPGIAGTSPLGVTPGSRVSPAGIPMGSTELASPGISPPPTGTLGMTGTGTTCSATGGSSAMSGLGTTFDGGGSHVGQQHHFAGPRQFDELRVDRGLVLENIQPSTCDLA